MYGKSKKVTTLTELKIKREIKWKLLLESFNDCNLGTFTGTYTAPDQAVNPGELGHRDIPKTEQPHILDDVVCSRSENGRSRKRRISECLTVYYFDVCPLACANKSFMFFGRKSRCTS